MRWLALLSFVCVACKADAQKCEQAARNYATLTYWKKADAEIAKVPAADREKLRKEKLAAFTYELESKIDVVVSQCQSAGNDDQIDCMINAKTAEQVSDCADLVPAE